MTSVGYFIDFVESGISFSFDLYSLFASMRLQLISKLPSFFLLLSSAPTELPVQYNFVFHVLRHHATVMEAWRSGHHNGGLEVN